MLSRRQLWALVGLTLMWGVNWPMMKLSLQELTPLYFRASTMFLGAAWLFVYVQRHGERMWPQGRAEWLTIAWLGLPNVLGWHTLSIFGVLELASGRAAIIGFTMPIFTVLLGAAFFGERITPRVRLAVVAAAIAIGLLLWHELQSLSGRPAGIAWMLGAAACWGLGTLMFKRAHFQLSAMAVQLSRASGNKLTPVWAVSATAVNARSSSASGASTRTAEAAAVELTASRSLTCRRYASPTDGPPVMSAAAIPAWASAASSAPAAAAGTCSRTTSACPSPGAALRSVSISC